MRAAMTWPLPWLALVALAGCGGGGKTLGRDEPFEPKQVQCTVDGEVETRMTRDCSTELSYQERRIGARLEILGQQLGGDSEVQFRPVESSLTMLLEQQRGLCRDWNACALSRQEYVNRSEWLTSQFSTLVRLLDSADPSTMEDDESRQRLVEQVLQWAERARQRQAHARLALERVDVEHDRVDVEARRNDIEEQRRDTAKQTGQAARIEADADQAHAGAIEQRAGAAQVKAGAQERVTSATETETEAMRRSFEEQSAFQEQLAEQQQGTQQSARRRMQVTLEQQQQKVADLEKLVKVLGAVGGDIEDAEEGKAPAVCRKRTLRQRLDAMGDSDERTVSSQTERVMSAVDDLCERFATWRDPDERLKLSINRFFTQLDRIEGWLGGVRDRKDGAEAKEAARALRLLAGLRQRTLRGVRQRKRPFPCFTKAFRRIAEMEWNGSIARAQMPGIESSAERVCKAAGIDSKGLERAVEDLESRLASAEDYARRDLRSSRASIQRLRAMLR